MLTILTLVWKPRLDHTKDWCLGSILTLYWGGGFFCWITLGFEPRLAQLQAKSIGLWTDTYEIAVPEGVGKCWLCPVCALYPDIHFTTEE